MPELMTIADNASLLYADFLWPITGQDLSTIVYDGPVTGANALGLLDPSVSQWTCVSHEYDGDLEHPFGLPRWLLRPDHYRSPDTELKHWRSVEGHGRSKASRAQPENLWSIHWPSEFPIWSVRNPSSVRVARLSCQGARGVLCSLTAHDRTVQKGLRMAWAEEHKQVCISLWERGFSAPDISLRILGDSFTPGTQ